MSNAAKIQRLRRLEALQTRPASLLECPLTDEDRQLLNRLPVRLVAQYRHADALDARLARQRMRTRSRSIVESVCTEEAALQLHARRQALSSARSMSELVAAGEL